MHIQLTETDVDIERCFPIMVQLRPHQTLSTFTEQVKRQQEQSGYHLVCLEGRGAIKAVAGFRIHEMLSRGRFLYIDDLITDTDERSKGYVSTLFDWLVAYARAHNCDHLELDSGVERAGAHRFYFQKRMQISGFHFRIKLSDQAH